MTIKAFSGHPLSQDARAAAKKGEFSHVCSYKSCYAGTTEDMQVPPGSTRLGSRWDQPLRETIRSALETLKKFFIQERMHTPCQISTSKYKTSYKTMIRQRNQSRNIQYTRQNSKNSNNSNWQVSKPHDAQWQLTGRIHQRKQRYAQSAETKRKQNSRTHILCSWNWFWNQMLWKLHLGLWLL